LPLQAPPKLSTDIKVERGFAPDAGFAHSESAPASVVLAVNGEERRNAARQQAQVLVEFVRQFKGSLALDDILSLFAGRLKLLLPHDTMVIYLRRGDALLPHLVNGENFRLFSSLRIPLGEGLSGWVAQNHKPILNGNPSVEPGYLNDDKHSVLRSALAVPLEGSAGVAAVLAFYRAAQDAFNREDLEVAEVVASRMAALIEQSTPKAAAVGAH